MAVVIMIALAGAALNAPTAVVDEVSVTAVAVTSELAAIPLASVVPRASATGSAVPLCRLKPTLTPRTGIPVAASTTVARSGVLAEVQADCGLPDCPAMPNVTSTLRLAPEVLNTSGMVTALVAPRVSVRVAVTVVLPVAVAGQLTEVSAAVGAPNVQSVRAAFHRIEVTASPGGRIGVTEAVVLRPGTTGLATVTVAPSLVGGPTTPLAENAATPSGVPRPVGPSQPAFAVHSAVRRSCRCCRW